MFKKSCIRRHLLEVVSKTCFAKNPICIDYVIVSTSLVKENLGRLALLISTCQFELHHILAWRTAICNSNSVSKKRQVPTGWSRVSENTVSSASSALSLHCQPCILQHRGLTERDMCYSPPKTDLSTKFPSSSYCRMKFRTLLVQILLSPCMVQIVQSLRNHKVVL